MKSYIFIDQAIYVSDYKIKLKFNDGMENTVDFKKFITQSHHPDIQKYINIKKFKNFKLEYGELEWNNYELMFPIYDLYLGKI